MTDREMVLSEDFVDLLLDAQIPQASIPAEGTYYYRSVDEDLGIMYRERDSMPLFNIGGFTYQIVPSLFGLMQITDGEEAEETTGGIAQGEEAGGITEGEASTTFDPTALLRSGILEVQRPPLSLTGRGVIIGFIDTGIRYDNDVFKNPDGTSRILSIWDQTIQTGTPPEEYVYGTEYTRDMINEALASENPREIVPSYDEDGHGTAMASVAAGSILGRGLNFHGAAPDSDIVMVKCKEAKQNMKDYYLINEGAKAYSEVDIILGIRYLQSLAISFERPVVICIGMGTNMGDHTGSSSLPSYMNRVAVKRSVAIVVCNGNEGNTEHHYYGELSHDMGGVEYSEVEIRVDENERGFVAELWGNLPSTLAVAVRTPGGETTEVVDFRSRERRDFTFVFVDTEVQINYIMVEQNSGAELIMIKFINPVSGVWTIQVSSVRLEAGRSERFNIWLPIRQFLHGNTYFLQPVPYVTITEPAFAREVISSSTYNDSNSSFYAVTGRGFNREGGIKPDFSAPGVNVDTVIGKQSGSSIAASITAGAVAQFMQWAVVERNSIYAETGEVKSYLIRGAVRTQDMNYPNREWGFGRLDIAGTFRQMAGLD